MARYAKVKCHCKGFWWAVIWTCTLAFGGNVSAEPFVLTIDASDPNWPYYDIDMDGIFTRTGVVRVGPISVASYATLRDRGLLPSGYPTTRSSAHIIVIDPNTGYPIRDEKVVNRALVEYQTLRVVKLFSSRDLYHDWLADLQGWRSSLGWLEGSLEAVDIYFGFLGGVFRDVASGGSLATADVATVWELAKQFAVEQGKNLIIGKSVEYLMEAIADGSQSSLHVLKKDYSRKLEGYAAHLEELDLFDPPSGILIERLLVEEIRRMHVSSLSFVLGGYWGNKTYKDYGLALYHIRDAPSAAWAPISRAIESFAMSFTLAELTREASSALRTSKFLDEVGRYIDPSLATKAVAYKTEFVVAGTEWALLKTENIVIDYLLDHASVEVLNSLPELRPFRSAVASQEAALLGDCYNTAHAELALQRYLREVLRNPAAISNLNATAGTNSGQVGLTWSVPYSFENVAVYKVFYSEQAIEDEPSPNVPYVWLNATKAYGQTESLDISNLNPNVQYHFRVEARDALGNWSALSNEAVGYPQSTGQGTHFFFDPRVNPQYGTASTSRYVFSVWLHNSLNQTFPGTVTLDLGGTQYSAAAVAGTVAPDGSGWKRQYEVAVNRTFAANTQTPYFFSVVIGLQTIQSSPRQLSVDTVLSNGHVEPPSAANAQMFNFSTVYRNSDGLKPRSVQLYLKGGGQFYPYAMEFVDGNQVSGFRYAATKYCGAENNQFYFVVIGADGTAYREPATGANNGPTVAVVHAFTVLDFKIQPENPKGGDKAKLSVEFQNTGSVVESNLTIEVLANSNSIGQAAYPILGVLNGTALTFEWNVPLVDSPNAVHYDLKARVSNANTSVEKTLALDVLPPPGIIQGVVRNPDANPSSGVVVRVISTQRSIASTVSEEKTSERGFYKLDALMPGTYDIEFSKPGVGRATLQNVTVHAGQTRTENVTLTGNNRIRLTGQDYGLNDVSQLMWSPDGSRIAAATIGAVGPGEPDQNVRIFPISGGTPYRAQTLTYWDGTQNKERGSIGGAWTPTGELLLVDYRYRSLQIVSNTGASPRLFYPTTDPAQGGTNPYDGFRTARWNIPRNKVTWTADGYLRVIDPNNLGAPPQTVANLALYSGDLAAWSPDGTKLMTTTLRWVTTWEVNLQAGTARKIFEFPGAPFMGCWMPDSQTVVIPRQSENTTLDLFVTPCDRADYQQITFTSNLDETFPAVKPDGRKIAYLGKGTSDSYWSLYIEDLNVPSLIVSQLSVTPETITSNGDGLDDFTTVSLKVNRDCLLTVKIYDFRQRLLRTIVEKEPTSSGVHSLIWNGTNDLGLIAPDGVYDVRADAHDDVNGESALTVSGQVAVCRAASGIPGIAGGFSSDGSRLAMRSNAMDVLILNLANDRITTLGLNNVSGHVFPNSTFSRFAYRAPGSPTVVLEIRDSSGTLILQKQPYRPYHGNQDVGWKPDSSSLVYQEERRYESSQQWPGGLFIMEPSGGNDHAIYYETGPNPDTQSLAPNAADPAWSPLSNQIAFVCNRETYLLPYPAELCYDVFTINPDGSGIANFTQEPDLRHGVPTFTPDGMAILYTSNRGRGAAQDRIWLQSLNHVVERRLLARASSAYPIAVSPDGFSVANGYNLFYLFQSLIRGTVTGTVLLEDGKTPASGALVEVAQNHEVKYATVSNPWGAFQIMNVLPGTYGIIAKGDHYKEGTTVSITVQSGELTSVSLGVTRLPTAFIVSPYSASRRSNRVTIESVVDDPRTSQVAFYSWRIGSTPGQWTLLGSATKEPFNLVWDTTTTAEGMYQVKAIAEKASLPDNAPTTTSVVIDRTAPQATITRPLNGDVLTGAQWPVEAACPDSDLERVDFEYRLQGSEVWTHFGASRSIPYRVALYLNTLVPGGQYSIRARATDWAGNSAIGSTISVTVVPGSVPSLEFPYSAPSGSEGGTSVALQLILSEASTQTVSVHYSATGGTATGGGVDYVLTDGMVSFSPGETRQSLYLEIVDDAIEEADETVIVSLSFPTNAELGSRKSCTYRIWDNDRRAYSRGWSLYR